MEGHTAVLLITETSDLAADLLVLAARDRGIAVLRFNQDDFPSRARVLWQDPGETRFHCDGQEFAESDISGAWFRRSPRPAAPRDPAAGFAARECAGFLGGVWETASWFWMSRPSAVARAEHKLLQLRHARLAGFSVPTTLATNCAEAARSFVQRNRSVAKTVVGGRLAIDGIGHAVFTSAVTSDDLRDPGAIEACPAIFQSRIEKPFDVRVTVVGERLFAARILIEHRSEQDVDWRQADPTRLIYQHHRLPDDLEARCKRLVASLGLKYGALDFVATPEGDHFFLEINPSGQWGWIERALGLPITDAILDQLSEGGQ